MENNLSDKLIVDSMVLSLPPPPPSNPTIPPEAAASLSPSATPEELLLKLHDPDLREIVMVLLIKKRETRADLPLLLWNSFSTVFILLQEVTSIYKVLSPGVITSAESNRVCNALALLQCMAANPETRMGLVRAKVPVYLYPFLGPTENEKPLEYLRLTSLGVIGAIVKIEDSHSPEVVHFFLETEVFPLCLRCMDHGNEITKTVSALIVMKILAQDEGLEYCCAFAERFYSAVQVLGRLVDSLPLEKPPNLHLLRYVSRCYLRLSQVPNSPWAMDTFRRCIPAKLTDEKFINTLHEDPQTARMLQQLSRIIKPT